MDKKELGNRIANKIRNADIELLQKTMNQISDYVLEFYTSDIGLESQYDEVEASYSGSSCSLRVFNVNLNYSLIDSKIVVTQTVDGDTTTIDEISIINGVPRNVNGKFANDQIDWHLIMCFKDLIENAK